MSNDRVIVERDGHIAHVQLNRPDKKNAIDGAMFTQLREAATSLAADRSVWAIVLSGAGHTFCSGLDMANFARMASGEVRGDTVTKSAVDLSAEGATPAQQTAWLWHEMATPVIAAVEGHALGAGFHIALAADLRVVAPSAKIGFVEITWGLVPDLSGTQGLRRLVSLDVAKRLIYTGEIISGTEAFEPRAGDVSRRASGRAGLRGRSRHHAAQSRRAARRQAVAQPVSDRERQRGIGQRDASRRASGRNAQPDRGHQGSLRDA